MPNRTVIPFKKPPRKRPERTISPKVGATIALIAIAALALLRGCDPLAAADTIRVIEGRKRT